MIRRSCILFMALFLTYNASAHALGSNTAYSRIRWNHIPVNVVTVNLNSPDLKVTPALPRDGIGSSESFSSMLHRLCPAAAITGTFFCTRSLHPTGDIVINGNRAHEGSVGVGVCLSQGNTVDFIPIGVGQAEGWQEYETVLCVGPTLVRSGLIHLSPKTEGFKDGGLYRRRRRAALGVTENNKLLLVTVEDKVYLRTLAKIMLHLGAQNAFALDGGSSAALYYQGKVISRPGRKLTNLLVVYDQLTAYYRHRAGLAPAPACTTSSETGGRVDRAALLAPSAYSEPRPGESSARNSPGGSNEPISGAASSIAEGSRPSPKDEAP